MLKYMLEWTMMKNDIFNSNVNFLQEKFVAMFFKCEKLSIIVLFHISTVLIISRCGNEVILQKLNKLSKTLF